MRCLLALPCNTLVAILVTLLHAEGKPLLDLVTNLCDFGLHVEELDTLGLNAQWYLDLEVLVVHAEYADLVIIVVAAEADQAVTRVIVEVANLYSIEVVHLHMRLVVAQQNLEGETVVSEQHRLVVRRNLDD